MLGVTGQLAGSGPLGLRPSSSSARRLRPSAPAVARPPLRLTAATGSTRSVPQLHSGFAREAPSAPSAAAPPAPAQRGGVPSAWRSPPPRLVHCSPYASRSVFSPARPSQPEVDPNPNPNTHPHPHPNANTHPNPNSNANANPNPIPNPNPNPNPNTHPHPNPNQEEEAGGVRGAEGGGGVIEVGSK